VTEPDSRPRGSSLSWAVIILWMLMILTVLGVIFGIRAVINRIPTVEDVTSALAPEPFENIGPTVVRSIRSLANLTTVEYVEYTIVEKGTESGILTWATGDSLTLLAVARIGAGVDLSALDSDSFRVNQDTGVVTVFLPPAEIQYIAVDNEATQVLDRSTGIFTHGDPRLETDARQVAEEVLVNQALETGIIDDAAENAVEVLTNFLLGLGYTDVRVQPE
jgi:hypothetical protein